MSEDVLQRDGTPRAVYLIQGDDPSLVAQEIAAVLTALLESGAISSDAIEEYGEPGQADELDVGTVLNACSTPPFFSERRVVVVRDASGFDAAAQRAIAAYLDSPLETSVLLLAQVSRLNAALSKAVAACGLVVKAQPGGGKARIQWITEHLHESGLRFDAPAGALVAEHLGEDLARLDGLVQTLLATYGPNASIHPAEVEPFLGEAGSVAPWDLTDALDEGDTRAAIRALHRMMEAGDRHPLQLLAILHRHYGAMLRLDGAEIADEAAASIATGLAPFPAKKVLRQARRLGHERVARAIELLAAADLDLRGQIAWPEALVMEVLVARLAQLVRLGQSASTQRARARG